MTSPEIRPRLIDGEPICDGVQCPSFYVVERAGDVPLAGKCTAAKSLEPAFVGSPCPPGLRRLLAEARGALRLAESAIADECNDGCESEEDRAAGCVFDAPEPCAIGVALRAVRTVLYAPAPSGADGGEGEGK